MSREDSLSSLMLKTMLDDEFRQMLVKDPEEVAASIGVELDPSQADHIRELDLEELERLVILLRRTLFTAAGTLW